MPDATDRRTFLQVGAAASASALALSKGLRAQEPDAKKPIPRRLLGKTGVEITMLEAGAVRDSAAQILRLSLEVSEEDNRLCEGMQVGMSSGAIEREYLLGENEALLLRFHALVRDALA